MANSTGVTAKQCTYNSDRVALVELEYKNQSPLDKQESSQALQKYSGSPPELRNISDTKLVCAANL